MTRLSRARPWLGSTRKKGESVCRRDILTTPCYLAKISDNLAVISKLSNPRLCGALVGMSECVAVWTCRYGVRISGRGNGIAGRILVVWFRMLAIKRIWLLTGLWQWLRSGAWWGWIFESWFRPTRTKWDVTAAYSMQYHKRTQAANLKSIYDRYCNAFTPWF